MRAGVQSSAHQLLPASGRFNVIRQTPSSSTSYSTASVMLKLHWAGGRQQSPVLSPVFCAKRTRRGRPTSVTRALCVHELDESRCHSRRRSFARDPARVDPPWSTRRTATAAMHPRGVQSGRHESGTWRMRTHLTHSRPRRDGASEPGPPAPPRARAATRRATRSARARGTTDASQPCHAERERRSAVQRRAKGGSEPHEALLLSAFDTSGNTTQQQ